MCIFFYLVFLVKPQITTNGSKFFKLAYETWAVPLGLAVCVAFFSWLIEDVLLYRFLSRQSSGLVFLFRLAVLVGVLSFVFLLVSAYHYHNKLFTHFDQYFVLLRDFIFSRTTASLFLIGIIISNIINLAKVIRLKIGINGFLKIVTGYYRTPREEDRIFIFIDLVSSTQCAELLGHKKYSAFLQKCFEPLGILELKYRAQQYQIIGDEVVLTWSALKTNNFRNAVRFYFEFMYELQLRRGQFEREFGIVPAFSASINSGNIMVSELGSIKNEIAFHGDVLNTAARIQKQCKSYKRRLLVTKHFSELFVPVSESFRIEWVGSNQLTGKEKAVEIYSIEPEFENEIGDDYCTVLPNRIRHHKNNGRQNKAVHKNIVGHAE